MNEDALEYYDTKLQQYLHPYDEGKRNIQEFKILTLKGLRNLEMMRSCCKELSQRTIKWAAISLILEDQLTVQKNWNLHPRKRNLDLIGLKDAYWPGEENHLGNTGQVRMEVNMVTAPVMSAPVIYATASQAQTWTALVIADCEDTLDNCYPVTSPGM